jgi:hypothetical protein
MSGIRVDVVDDRDNFRASLDAVIAKRVKRGQMRADVADGITLRRCQRFRVALAPVGRMASRNDPVETGNHLLAGLAPSISPSSSASHSHVDACGMQFACGFT